MSASNARRGYTVWQLVTFFCLFLVAGYVIARWWFEGEVGTGQSSGCQAAGGSGPWPVELSTDQSSYLPLGQNYLQWQGGYGTHTGIDVMASPGSKVFAVEGGRIIDWSEVGNPPVFELLIEPLAEEASGAGFIYGHVQESTLDELAFGMEVMAGQSLGVVAVYELTPGYDHLHLERVTFESGPQGAIETYSPDGNPLESLESTNDTEAPKFLSIVDVPPTYPAGTQLALIKDQSELEYLSPTAIPLGEPVDVVVHVSDRPGNDSEYENVPYCTKLTIRHLDGSVDDEVFTVRFDVPWVDTGPGDPDTFVHLNEDYEVLNSDLEDDEAWLSAEIERSYYLALTNRMFENDCWKPNAIGPYKIKAEVFDSAGNHSSSDTLTVTVTN